MIGSGGGGNGTGSGAGLNGGIVSGSANKTP